MICINLISKLYLPFLVSHNTLFYDDTTASTHKRDLAKGTSNSTYIKQIS